MHNTKFVTKPLVPGVLAQTPLVSVLERYNVVTFISVQQYHNFEVCT